MSPFAAHCLTVAAQMPVDAAAYNRHAGLNLAKLRLLADGYRQGWLHNVLTRITPFTVRDPADYALMAELFTPNAATAMALLDKLAADLTRFAVAAGINHHAPESAGYQQLRPHLALYQAIAQGLATRFDINIPAPFAPVTVYATPSEPVPFLRSYLTTRRAA